MKDLIKKFLSYSFEMKIFIITIIVFTFFIIGSTVYAYWFLNNSRNIEVNISDKCVLPNK